MVTEKKNANSVYVYIYVYTNHTVNGKFDITMLINNCYVITVEDKLKGTNISLRHDVSIFFFSFFS